MDISNLMGGLDQGRLMDHLNNMDPFEMLSQFGYKGDEAKKILSGNMTPIIEKIDTERDTILDYSIITASYGKYFNPTLVEYFFKMSKNKKAFSEDEINAYQNAFNKWFDLVFQVGKNFVYEADAELKDQSIMIKLDTDYYQMSIMDDIKAIIYIKDFQPLVK